MAVTDPVVGSLIGVTLFGESLGATGTVGPNLDAASPSFDKVVEIQTEFAKSAFETFVAESQKIGALYSDLAKQSYKPFAGFVAKMAPTNQ